MGQQVRLADRASSSSSMQSRVWWKGLWNMQLPGKIKIFMWRLFLDRLPTISNLNVRGLDLPNLCSFCGRRGEDALHIFWLCKFSRLQWTRCSIARGAVLRVLSSISLLLQDLKEGISWDEFAVLATFLWGLWNAQNRLRLQGLVPTSDIGPWALQYV